MQKFMKKLQKFDEIAAAKGPRSVGEVSLQAAEGALSLDACVEALEPSPCRARRWAPRPITLSEARSRLDRSRFSRPNTHFLAFFKIYKKIIFSRANFANFCHKIGNFAKV